MQAALEITVGVVRKLDAETGLIHHVITMDGVETEALCGRKARDFKTTEQTRRRVREAKDCARCLETASHAQR